MKIKLYPLLIFLLFFGLESAAQPVLSRATHALRLGDHHEMRKAEYVKPSEAGANLRWDYSQLIFTDEEVNDMVEVGATPYRPYDSLGNLAIKITDELYSFFDIDDEGSQHIGMATQKYRIIYDQPVQRMVYPFTFGSYDESSFAGQAFYQRSTNEIVGDQYISGDAFGTLILPNQLTINNVLRVKTEHHKYEYAYCYAYETHQTKYLFYAQNRRYPLFAIVETQWIKGNDTSYHFTAGVDKSLLSDVPQAEQIIAKKQKKEYECHVSPNPFEEHLNIWLRLEEKTKVSIELLNMRGRRLRVIQRAQWMEAGVYPIQYNGNGLPAASYMLRFKIDDEYFSKQVIKIK